MSAPREDSRQAASLQTATSDTSTRRPSPTSNGHTVPATRLRGDRPRAGGGAPQFPSAPAVVNHLSLGVFHGRWLPNAGVHRDCMSTGTYYAMCACGGVLRKETTRFGCADMFLATR
ncbi:hypothetical protein PGT21_008765 [Puccinia graminis f. sp. tritici]|uniref:Uncharacterized protein n=1 Tax=Puccinia graminis f. sp. tritici TaxID=56615 RepID=A0A5B0MTZ8_PUCGR|nr:hypothetical protein PGT21_008765 [Puccinia graminis f. sp. tritici]KAA1131433.1 hypothetical protein PGTUg99_013558 [Puccinia graminis f. sp. tritici]